MHSDYYLEKPAEKMAATFYLNSNIVLSISPQTVNIGVNTYREPSLNAIIFNLSFGPSHISTFRVERGQDSKLIFIYTTV